MDSIKLEDIWQAVWNYICKVLAYFHIEVPGVTTDTDTNTDVE